MRYFEDFRVGERLPLAARTFSEAEIVAFARRWDPQPFHTDPAAARDSAFGGLVASGWHTCAVMMSMLVDCWNRERAAAVGSPGADRCDWLRPVRPGDTLAGTYEVLETWPSRSRPFGFVRGRVLLTNQHGEAVLELVGLGLFARRPEAAA